MWSTLHPDAILMRLSLRRGRYGAELPSVFIGDTDTVRLIGRIYDNAIFSDCRISSVDQAWYTCCR